LGCRIVAFGEGKKRGGKRERRGILRRKNTPASYFVGRLGRLGGRMPMKEKGGRGRRV